MPLNGDLFLAESLMAARQIYFPYAAVLLVQRSSPPGAEILMNASTLGAIKQRLLGRDCH